MIYQKKNHQNISILFQGWYTNQDRDYIKFINKDFLLIFTLNEHTPDNSSYHKYYIYYFSLISLSIFNDLCNKHVSV